MTNLTGKGNRKKETDLLYTIEHMNHNKLEVDDKVHVHPRSILGETACGDLQIESHPIDLRTPFFR